MKKFGRIVLLLGVLILALGVLAGCGISSEVDRDKFQRNVILLCNGGQIAQRDNADLYFPQDALIPRPGASSAIARIERANYTLRGWFRVEVDGDNKPIMNGNDYVIMKRANGADWEWDFFQDKVTEDLTLVAMWTAYPRYVVAERNANGEWNDYSVLFDPNVVFEETDYADDIQSVTSSSIYLDEVNVAFDAAYNANDADPGYTAIDYYWNADLSGDAVQFPYSIAASEQTVFVIYPQVIEGKYSVVNTWSDFRGSINSNNNIYIKQDITADVRTISPFISYSGTILGNDHTISGINVAIRQTTCSEGVNGYGLLFGELSNAVIKDLNIQISATFTIAVNPEQNILDAICYIAVAKTAQDVVFENVNITASCSVERSIEDTGRFELIDGRPVAIREPNTYAVTVEFDGNCWLPQAAQSGVTVTNSVLNAELTYASTAA